MKSGKKSATSTNNSSPQEVVISVDSSVIKLVALIIVGILVITLAIVYTKTAKDVGSSQNRAGAEVAQEQQGPVRVPSVIDGSPVLGKEDAPITIFEYSDFECPFCARHANQTYHLIKEKYIDTGKAKYVFKNLIVVPSHEPTAKPAAYAAYCVYKLGGSEKFWDYKVKLFEAMSSGAGKISESSTARMQDLKKFKQGLIDLAVQLGIDKDQMEKCMADPKEAQEQLEKDTRYALEKIAPKLDSPIGTPMFVICKTPPDNDTECQGEVILGAYPFSEFERVIDNMLKN